MCQNPKSVTYVGEVPAQRNHAGSNQLGRIAAGDILWIVTTGEADEPGLAGDLRVGAVVSFCCSEAEPGRDDFWHY